MVFETPPKVLGTHRRHVVPLGHRHRPARPRSRRWAASTCSLPPGYDGPLPEGGFFVARARTNRVAGPRPLVPGEQTIRSPRPKRSGSSPRSIPTRPAASARPSPSSWPARPGSARSRRPPPTVFHEGSGKVMNTIPPNDFSLLRDAQRGRAAGAGHLARPRADGTARRHRHRQGQAVRARCADEEDPDRSARGRQRHLAQPVHESARSELVLLPRLGLVELPVRHRLRVRDADPDDHAARASEARSRPPATAAGCAHELLLRRHRHHARRWPCA